MAKKHAREEKKTLNVDEKPLDLKEGQQKKALRATFIVFSLFALSSAVAYRYGLVGVDLNLPHAVQPHETSFQNKITPTEETPIIEPASTAIQASPEDESDEGVEIFMEETETAPQAQIQILSNPNNVIGVKEVVREETKDNSLLEKITELENKLTDLSKENQNLSENLKVLASTQKEEQDASHKKNIPLKMNTLLLLEELRSDKAEVDLSLFDQVLSDLQNQEDQLKLESIKKDFASGRIQQADLKESLQLIHAQLMAQESQAAQKESANLIQSDTESGTLKSWASNFISRYVRVYKKSEKSPEVLMIEEFDTCLDTALKPCLKMVEKTTLLQENKNLESFKKSLSLKIRQEEGMRWISQWLAGGQNL